eukprot:3297463-Rhodomonas_salina.1
MRSVLLDREASARLFETKSRPSPTHLPPPFASISCAPSSFTPPAPPHPSAQFAAFLRERRGLSLLIWLRRGRGSDGLVGLLVGARTLEIVCSLPSPRRSRQLAPTRPGGWRRASRGGRLASRMERRTD